MKAIHWLWLPVLVVSLVLIGCGEPTDGNKEKTYDIKGKVVSVDPNKKKVTLDHEDIAGLMKAMKMSFAVEDAKVVEGVEVGDEVHGKLKVKDGEYIITELHKR